jgi:hypothetical protein
MFAILKSLVLLAFRFGIAYALFFYVGHFTEPQSILLAIATLIAVNASWMQAKSALNQPPEFEPFWVRIEPNWYMLSQDFGLTDVKRWEEFLKTRRPDSQGYSVLQNGITFTMLSQSLFYSDDRHHFFGDLDLQEEIKEMTPEPAAKPYLRAIPPCFYVKRSVTGEKKKIPVFEFGLRTQESMMKSRHPADREADIVVAHLPEIVFYHYFNADADYFGVAKKVEEQTNADLTAFGWTQKEEDPEDSWLHRPYDLNHKYLSVHYKGIA